MIIYNPLDGDAYTSSIQTKPRHCFLMTRLGNPIPPEVERIRDVITQLCVEHNYSVIDASSQITGKDFLIKIWKLVAACPLSIGIIHEEIPEKTLCNIYYELGVAQAMGKETLIVKSQNSEIPSDFVRTEYLVFDNAFPDKLRGYFETLFQVANHYETVADQLDRNPILAIDYLKRAFLITGNADLRNKVKDVIDGAKLDERAKNSVELVAANF